MFGETFRLECEESDSKTNDESKKHLLSSGVPCTIHSCVKCCVETRMPLTRLDVERISEQGYRVKDFVVKNGNIRRLKNVDGGCVFLGEDGCTIYSFRPEGCRLYPLVYDKNLGRGVIHGVCPYGHEFKVGSDDLEKLCAIVERLDKKEF
jgi:hypothetical protein